MDDTAANLHSMKKLLEQLDVNVITADSGNEALTHLLKYEFMLILLDIHMPIMDGYETAELISQVKEYQHIPIIFITANDKERQHIFKGYEAGAVDYLFKPINPEIVISKVKVFYKMYKQKSEICEQKNELDILLQKKNELLLEVKEQNKNKDILLSRIKKQTKRLKISFTTTIIASLVIIVSITWLNSIIAMKNAQLINYTELLNEKNILFSDLKKALSEDKDLKVQELLQIFEESDVKSLTKRWAEEPQFEWKNSDNLTTDDNEARYKIVATIAQLANIIAKRDKFIIPTAPHDKFHDTYGWIAYGTKDKKSDVDYSIVTIDDHDHLYSYNAIQGRKAVIASVIFRALFGSTSLKLLDTEFYPPSIGTFINETLSSRASLMAIFSQIANFYSLEELNSFEKILREECKKLGLDSVNTIMKMLRDAELLHNDVEAIRKIVPNPELANNIISNKITLSMTECGDEIDKLPINDPARTIYLDTFALLYILRTHFLPEGFISKGAFRVICEDIRGQKHQLAHRKIEEEALSKKIDFAIANQNANLETAQRSLSTPQEFLESVGENGAFFHHRSDLIDASKYGSRVYEGALELIRMFKGYTHDKTLSDEISILEKKISEKAVEMSVLESAKRRKFFEKAFLQVVRKTAQEEANQLFSNVQDKNLFLVKTEQAAKNFFNNADFGRNEFIVLEPEQRIKAFKNELEKNELSPRMLAIAESVARVPHSLHRDFAEKIIHEEALNEMIQMKKRRKQSKISDEQLFIEVKKEIRETTAVLLAYSLKIGIIQTPAAEDTALFKNVKAEVEETIVKLIKNARNIGIAAAPQILRHNKPQSNADNISEDDYSRLWETDN